MGQIVPDAVERYLASLNRLPDEALAAIYDEARRHDLPAIDPEVGAFLHVLTRAIGARRVLELGTANGYSGVWLARALPADGVLISFERNAERARMARASFERAGVARVANVMVGDASLLVNKVAGPFDLIFQDSDKRLYEPLLDRLVRLLRPEGVLVSDNVLWHGRVVPGLAGPNEPDDPIAPVVSAYNARLASHPSLRTAWIPLRDGLAISVKIDA